MTAPEFTTIRYEAPVDGVARLVLARPDKRNAQNRTMLYELNDAVDLVAGDDDARVLILAADGPDFSSGHDLGDLSHPDGVGPVGTWRHEHRPGAEGWMAFEHEVYLGLAERWRSIPKPTIAQVHGRTIAGGLLLVWVCDLVMASDDATFSDPVVGMGVPGVELFRHPWELGFRQAKEILFTGRSWTAAEAERWGMVNHVVPRAELDERTWDLARQVAAQPTFAVTLAKQAVDQALDAQGLGTALQAGFSLHQLAHAHNREQHGMPIDPSWFARKQAQARRPEKPQG